MKRHCRFFSSPFAEKSHQASAETHGEEGGQDGLEAGALHVSGKHELVGHKLDETSVDKDTGTDAVEDTVGDEGSLAAGSKGRADTEADGDSDGSADGVTGTQEVRGPALGLGPGDSGETGTQTETLEGLVEDEDNVESVELFTRNGKGQSDEDGVEDDTKLENEETGHLGSIGLGDDTGSLLLSLGPASSELVVDVRA